MSSRNDIGFEIGIPNIRMNITDTNRSIAEQFNEAFNRGDLDVAASCFAASLIKQSVESSTERSTKGSKL